MTNFAIQAYLGYKGLYTWLNWHAFTSSVLLRPVLVLAMYFLVGRFASPESAERYHHRPGGLFDAYHPASQYSSLLP